jgi:hypothetical protein
VLGGCVKVLVRRQQGQIVFATELDEKGVNGANLHAATTAGVSDFCCFDVIFPNWLQEGER